LLGASAGTASAGGADSNIDWDRLYNEDPIEWVRQREVMREKQEKAASYSIRTATAGSVIPARTSSSISSACCRRKQQEALLAIDSRVERLLQKAKAEKAVAWSNSAKRLGFTPEELKECDGSQGGCRVA
jgi:hypothetical protein